MRRRISGMVSLGGGYQFFAPGISGEVELVPRSTGGAAATANPTNLAGPQGAPAREHLMRHWRDRSTTHGMLSSTCARSRRYTARRCDRA